MRERHFDAICRAAHLAGAAILDIYRTDFAVRGKADASPVTEADEQAERIILAALRDASPEIPVVAEEEIAAGRGPSTVGSRFWLVDPLDGTKEFISRNGEFTVNIALIEDGRPTMGVVYAPALGVTYAALGPGIVTRQQGDAAPAPIAVRPIPAAGAVIVHSRSHNDQSRLAPFVATCPEAECRVSGSSIKFCLIAAGEADYYPRFGTTMEWDTAAGQAVLEAAGGRVLTTGGAPLRYGKPDFRNPDFIAEGRRGA
jgi:3'(2'), 5'-bisphosphate nucleotidase